MILMGAQWFAPVSAITLNDTHFPELVRAVLPLVDRVDSHSFVLPLFGAKGNKIATEH